MSEIPLTAGDIVEDRPFTHPENSQDDLKTMKYMAQQLVDSYDDPAVCDFVPGKRPVCKVDTRNRYFRIYYVNPHALFAAKDIAVVGFFGQTRPRADVKPLIKADQRFETTFHEHPGLLSLSTVRLADGNFANLVLFTDPEAKDNWNNSPLHSKTVAVISPPYYEHIRLNNGNLPNGLDTPDDLDLIRVRYIDYNSDPPWRALRTF